jgi:hypothetical protein
MLKLTNALIVAAALIGATPAVASEILFTNGGSNYQESKNFTDGTVSVKVSAFSINSSSNKAETAWLGSWSPGMGVLNKANDGSHTIDNQGYTDFVILAFDQSVTLGSAMFSTGFYGGSDFYNDTDATIGYYTGSNFDISSLVGTSKSDISSLFSVYSSNSTGNGSQSRNINPGDNTSSVWLIGAAFSNPDRYRDGFKIKSLTYSVPTSGVPEPTTWAMMILGVGMIGGTLRRRQATAMPAAA